MIGRQFGSYTITAEIGQGGMGAVYLAEHPIMKKRAAVKVLLPEYSRNEELIARFFNEARAAARLSHPSIVDIYDCGTGADGSAFMVMEFLDGESLGQRLKNVGKMPWRAAVGIARQIAAAIGIAHAHQIVHRDLKPDNVFLLRGESGEDRVKVLDFGIAKLGSAGAEPREGPQTRTGILMGTPLYMSPEQCRGAGKVDHRCDIYALGCILYALLSGQPPFVKGGEGELIAAHIYEPVPPLGVPDVPPAVEAVIRKSLEKDPDARYPTMEALDVALAAAVAAPVGGGTRVMPSESVPVARTRALVTVPDRPTPEPTAGNTTLSQAVRPRADAAGRGRAPLWIGGAVALVLAAGGGVLTLRGSPDKETGEPAPAAAVTRPEPARPAAPPPPAPPPEPERPAPPPQPAVAETITLRLASSPPGARVLRDGEAVGETPLVLPLPRGSRPIKFTIERSGYNTRSVTITPERDVDESVTLRRREARPATPEPDPDESRKL